MLRLLKGCEKGLKQLQEAVKDQKPQRGGPSATQVAHCHGLVRFPRSPATAPLTQTGPRRPLTALRFVWAHICTRNAADNAFVPF